MLAATGCSTDMLPVRPAIHDQYDSLEVLTKRNEKIYAVNVYMQKTYLRNYSSIMQYNV